MKTVYFAHAMTDYNTERERSALYVLRKLFPKVVNPSDRDHSDAAESFKRAGKNAMDYFCALVREADALAYLPMPNGDIGPGVAKEVLEAAIWDKAVFEVIPGWPGEVRGHRVTSILGHGVLTIAEMRALLRFQPN